MSTPRPQREQSDDLKVQTIDHLRWDAQNRETSLDALVQHLISEAESAMKWYLVAKRSKKTWARFLRAGALLLTGVAAVLPILSQMWPDQLPPAWASVFGVLGLGLIGLDRFFGFSSAWMRFIAAEMRLKQVHQEFRLEYQTERAAWFGVPPNDEQVSRVLVRSKAFALEVLSIVQEETAAWIQEFQANLKNLEEAAKASSAATEGGALNITVENGDQCPNGWTLSLDNTPPAQKSGRSAAINGLSPGLHVIRIEAKTPSGLKRAEATTKIEPRNTTSLVVTVS